MSWRILNHLPIVSFYAETRGWPFIISWCHRISGLTLLLYVWFHLYTLLSLSSPALYDATMKAYGFFFFRILQWALAIPIIFHALNGGRLILFDNFGGRNDESFIRWVLILSALYVMLLGLLMLMGTQDVSPVFFWLFTVTGSLTLSCAVISKIWAVPHTLFWKLQRISSAYLFVLAPAHMLFMNLNYAVAHDASTVIMRMQNFFIKGVDISLAASVLYHAGYGLATILGDYVGSYMLRKSLTILVVLIMVFFALVGTMLIITV